MPCYAMSSHAVPCHAMPCRAVMCCSEPCCAMPYPELPLCPPGVPSCLPCLCIRTSVYCDDTDLEHIPPLPPDTTYLYARFNRIGAIRAGDFMGLSMLEQGKGQALGQLCKDG